MIDANVTSHGFKASLLNLAKKPSVSVNIRSYSIIDTSCRPFLAFNIEGQLKTNINSLL